MSTDRIAPIGPRRLPPLTAASRPYWTGGAEGVLRLLRHKTSGRWVHPFEEIGEDTPDLEPTALSGKGTLYTFTVNYQSYDPAVPPPYVVALVELQEQSDLRVPANIVHCSFEDLRIGMPLRVVFEPQGELFVPLFEPDL